MQFNIVTLFQEIIQSAMDYGVVGRAIQRGLVQLQFVNPRQFTEDIHRTIDDRPFGGGDGMLLMAEPLKKSLDSLGQDCGHVVFLSPHGRRWCVPMVEHWVNTYSKITLICGRYGGVDQRFIEKYVDEEISLGDFVLSGGEVASLVIMDSIIRKIPGTLGNEISHIEESFQNSLLEYPQFTRPRNWEGFKVPKVLLSGDHTKVQDWKQKLSLVRTAHLRPDLLKPHHKEHLAKAIKDILNMDDNELSSCGLKRSDLISKLSHQ